MYQPLLAARQGQSHLCTPSGQALAISHHDIPNARRLLKPSPSHTGRSALSRWKGASPPEAVPPQLPALRAGLARRAG
eukprot:6470057-Amphidinium_carterae.1